MFVFISILIVIIAVLLVLIVIIQNSKGGGLAAGFASSNQVMGVRKTTDFLEKATWWLAGSMVGLCIVAAFFLPHSVSSLDSEIKDEILNIQIPNPDATAPFGTPIMEDQPSAGEEVPAPAE
jgi:preprotein translocase subunit SecG